MKSKSRYTDSQQTLYCVHKITEISFDISRVQVSHNGINNTKYRLEFVSHNL